MGLYIYSFLSKFQDVSNYGADNIRFYLDSALQGAIGGNDGSTTVSILNSSLSVDQSTSVSIGEENLVLVQFDYNENTTKLWVNPD